MLLRFSAANHLSIRDEQEVSFVATSSKHRDGICIRSDFSPSRSVLPSILLLSANGSGKSNLVHAIRTMQRMVLWSHTRWDPTGGIPRHSFQLDKKYAQSPSQFELDFVLDDIPYYYRLVASDTKFLFESLCAYPKSRQQLLFERNEDGFRFGRNLRGHNKQIAKLTRTNSLYISTAAQNGHEQLGRMFRYFKAIDIIGEGDIHDAAVRDEFLSDGPDQRVIDFLRELGTGVVGYRRTMQQHVDERMVIPQSFPYASTTLKSHAQIPIHLTHRNVDGQEIPLSFAYDGAGIRRLLVVLNRVFRTLDGGGTLCIDQLDASLHTRVTGAILQLFSLQNTNPNDAQLLATSHETNVLHSKGLRKDQFWFTEKDFYGVTRIYPLSDFRTRKNWNIEEAYIEGRFGAVPPRDFIPMFGAHDHEHQEESDGAPPS